MPAGRTDWRLDLVTKSVVRDRSTALRGGVRGRHSSCFNKDKLLKKIDLGLTVAMTDGAAASRLRLELSVSATSRSYFLFISGKSAVIYI